MKSKALSLFWSILAIGSVLLLSGCESTQTNVSQTGTQTTPQTAAPTEVKPAEKKPIPNIFVDGFEVVANYSEEVDMEMSSISEEIYGPDDTPFTFERTTVSEEQRSVTGGRIKVFPANNQTANLIFYRDVGLPTLKVEQLDDEYIRIWLRVRNLKDEDIFINVSCQGQDSDGHTRESYHYDTVIFSQDVFRDFTFVLKGDPTKRFSIIVVETQKKKSGLAKNDRED